MAKPEKVIPEKCVGYETKVYESELSQKDAILYSLGIGFSQDPMNETDLSFTYELHENFQVFPTIGTCIHKVDIFEALLGCPGIPNFNPMMLLHGEQEMEVLKPLEAGTKLKSKGKLVNIADKGKGALVTFEIETSEVQDDGKLQPVIINRIGIFIRGIGGFGHKGTPQKQIPSKPTSNPTNVVEDQTYPSQAIVYRLSGDYNPLHIDPNMASMGGFDKPILHGLCFYGIAAKVVVQTFCENQASQLKGIQARFTSSVYPGEKLKFNLWRNNNTIFFSGSTVERNNECIVGVAEIFDQPQAKL